MRSTSRPCSPVRHHEGHAKLAGSPPRASPVRMGPSYVLKKGWQDWAGGLGRRASARAAWGRGAGRAMGGLGCAELASPSPPNATGVPVGAPVSLTVPEALGREL